MDQIRSGLRYASEAEALEVLKATFDWSSAQASAAQDTAAALVEAAQASKRPAGQLESFLQRYSLTSTEGLALMCLAEALLRIPDKVTQNAMIADRIKAANWLEGQGSPNDWVVKAAGVGLMMGRKTLGSILKHISRPVIREAMITAMQFMGHQFILGETISGSIKNAGQYFKKGHGASFDMLGEGARTHEDAQRYFDAYAQAIGAIGQSSIAERGGISVKLSALYPRYEQTHRDTCVPALADKLAELAQLAASYDIRLTVDAEERARLDLSLEVIDQALVKLGNARWDGFGLAMQAYFKDSLGRVSTLSELAQRHGRRIHVRLVKGAYWDTEIKIAQEKGLARYPVFTRKVNTDVSYLVCAQRLMREQKHIVPLFGTHNAYTICALEEIAKPQKAGYELQRLHGMGEAVYEAYCKDSAVPLSIYAPVGTHKDLLPYLVRRLLENGASSSFVHKVLDKAIDPRDLAQDPIQVVSGHKQAGHPNIVLPHDLYEGEAPRGRLNSRGMDLDEREVLNELTDYVADNRTPRDAVSLMKGQKKRQGVALENTNPADSADNLGLVFYAQTDSVDRAFGQAKEAQKLWNSQSAQDRANIIERYADLLEDHREELIALCVREAGKTLGDCVAEIREAVDFCRYYANQGRRIFTKEGHVLPGVTGEDNRLYYEGRGVFVCISPWNFPLAIFTGQVIAAVMAGNAVLAKPAEQTPLIAMRAVELMHEAGIPEEIVQVVIGDGEIGAALCEHEDVAGVAFTGSFEVARSINRSLAARDGAIIPLIAETGGMNAMVVDSSALPEQVVDDVILSAFGSAGQRCSALRVLYVQEDIAETVLKMLKGAMECLVIGDPAIEQTDIGPVIDIEAQRRLQDHKTFLEGVGKPICVLDLREKIRNQGTFFAPCAYEIDGIEVLKEEIFGPVLHVIRFSGKDIGAVIEEINGRGYGLTFGVHSRIDGVIKDISHAAQVGNVYVNRSMTGAIVGSQPFGGHGLSGTGPKAGGPNYLQRFAHEKVISIDITASGGNAYLVSLDEAAL